MNNIRYRFGATLLVAIAVLTAGCAASRGYTPPPINPGDSVQINIELDSLPNASRIYFQNGMQIPKRDRDGWSTYCGLYVFNPDKKADYLTSVSPGIFEVSKVTGKTDIVKGDSPLDKSWNLFASLLWHDHSPPSYILYEVEMKLTSSEQPDVQTLTCSRKWGTYGYYYPGLADIRRALGDLIEIRLNSV